MQVLTVREGRELDAKAIAHFKHPGGLMEQAAKRAFDEALNQGWLSPRKHTLVLVGPGDNGGDALLIAKQIHDLGGRVTLLSYASHQGRSSLCESYYKAVTQTISTRTTDDISMLTFKDDLKDFDVIVDGWFGVGLSRTLEPILAQCLKVINETKALRLAIDLPSGLEGDSGLAWPIAFKADHTLVLGHYKTGHFLNDARDYVGTLHHIALTLPKCQPTRLRHWVVEPPKSFIKRKHHSHKYTYGHVLVMGGSHRFKGAPRLTSLAAMRSGCGLLSMITDDETMLKVLKDSPDVITYSESDFSGFPWSKPFVLAYGMGFGSKRAPDVLRQFLIHADSAVVDAEGIVDFDVLKEEAYHAHVTLTPHHHEAARLLNLDLTTFKQNPLMPLEAYAIKHHCTILLKGATTLVISPKETLFTTFGTPSLAVAGSGDVLAGILASVYAQNMKEPELTALYLHALSADLAAQRHHGHGVMASDIIDHLGEALTHFENVSSLE